MPADVLDRLEFVHAPNAEVKVTSFQMRLNDAAIAAKGPVAVKLRVAAVDGRIDGQDEPFPDFAKHFTGRMWTQVANSTCTYESAKGWRKLSDADMQVTISDDAPQRTVCFGTMMSFSRNSPEIGKGHTGTGAFSMTVEASKRD